MRCSTSAVLALALLAAAPPAMALDVIASEPPAPVPEFTFLDADGNEVALTELEGKAVVLNLWATWCAPCRVEMPSLDNLQAELGDEGLEVVALSMDRAGAERITAFYDEVGVENLAVYRDPNGKAGRALGAIGLPTTVIIDAEGNEVGRVQGGAEWDDAAAIAFLRQHLPE